jgi:hypothetical protein
MEFFAIDPIDVTVFMLQCKTGLANIRAFVLTCWAFHSFCHVKQVSHGCRGMSTEGAKVHKGHRIPLPGVSIFLHLHVSPTISTNFMVQGEIVLQNSPTKGD